MNIAKLKKSEIVHRWKWKCPIPGHTRHNGLEHPNCYDKLCLKQDERIGFLDIETSNLKATFGIIYTYVLKELDGEMLKRSIGLKDLYTARFDKPLLQQFIKDVEGYDRLVTHYGDSFRFDVPFLRTRALKWELDFPEYKMLYISDTYPMLKGKFKLHSNRLETACDFYGIPSKEHRLKPDIWLNMFTGNPRKMQKSLDYILQHNVEDVISLEALWKKINRFSAKSNTSI